VTQSRQAVLAAVRKRLAEEPDRVMPVLQLIADPDALIEPDDESAVSLARTLNAHRIVASLRELRARAYGTDEVREMLGGISRQAVSQRVRGNRLMAIEISGKSWFPDWQFRDGRPVPGLPQVIRALHEAGQDTFTADAVMHNPLPEERGRSLADLLQHGELDRVLHYVGAIGGGF
jgi:hypothetical protein